MNIKKIAEKAGVSVATISRVVNHPERVHPETREHVLSVMQKYNFRPNWFAQSLNLESSHTLALLIPGIETNFYQQIISGVETVAGNKKYAVIFCQTENQAAREAQLIEVMVNRRVDGIIQVSSDLDINQNSFLQNLTIPRIHIGKNRKSGCETLAYVDIEEGAYRLTRHLLRLGHKNIMILFNQNHGESREQIDLGFRRAVQESENATLFLPEQSKNSIQGGYLALQKLIQNDHLPDALVTASDLQAIGVIKAAHDLHLVIPDQLALASMTDSAVCTVLSPSVTAVELPSKKLGMAAARMLIDQIEDTMSFMDTPRDLILQPKLKVRESCGNKQNIYEWFD